MTVWRVATATISLMLINERPCPCVCSNQKLDADPFSKDVDPSSQRQGSVVSNESSFGKGLSDGQKDAFTSRKLGSEVLGS